MQDGVIIFFGVVGMLIKMIASEMEGMVYFDVFLGKEFAVFYNFNLADPIFDSMFVNKLDFVIRAGVACKAFEYEVVSL